MPLPHHQMRVARRGPAAVCVAVLLASTGCAIRDSEAGAASGSTVRSDTSSASSVSPTVGPPSPAADPSRPPSDAGYEEGVVPTPSDDSTSPSATGTPRQGANPAASDGGGDVAGVVRMYGGPEADGHMALDGAPATGMMISAVDDQGLIAAWAISDSSGHYELRLNPGHYTVPACRDDKVTVTAGRTTVLDVRCDVP